MAKDKRTAEQIAADAGQAHAKGGVFNAGRARTDQAYADAHAREAGQYLGGGKKR